MNVLERMTVIVELIEGTVLILQEVICALALKVMKSLPLTSAMTSMSVTTQVSIVKFSPIFDDV